MSKWGQVRVIVRVRKGIRVRVRVRKRVRVRVKVREGGWENSSMGFGRPAPPRVSA